MDVGNRVDVCPRADCCGNPCHVPRSRKATSRRDRGRRRRTIGSPSSPSRGQGAGVCLTSLSSADRASAGIDEGRMQELQELVGLAVLDVQLATAWVGSGVPVPRSRPSWVGPVTLNVEPSPFAVQGPAS